MEGRRELRMKKAFIQLVLGGVRSGKTKFAKECAEQRAGEFRIVDFPRDLNQFFAGETGIKTFIVDSMTAFVRDALKQGENPKVVLKLVDGVLDELSGHECAFIFVSNETAMAFQEDKALKTFMETLGEVNQRVAESSDEIYYMIAGIPAVVKKELELPAPRFSELMQSATGFMGMGMESGLQSMGGLLDMGLDDSLLQSEKEEKES